MENTIFGRDLVLMPPANINLRSTAPLGRPQVVAPIFKSLNSSASEAERLRNRRHAHCEDRNWRRFQLFSGASEKRSPFEDCVVLPLP